MTTETPFTLYVFRIHYIFTKKSSGIMLEDPTTDAGVQADIPEPDGEEPTVKIRPLERIKRHPKVPIEPSAYGKGKNFSRPWILQDGRPPPDVGSEMRHQYKIPKRAPVNEGKLNFIHHSKLITIFIKVLLVAICSYNHILYKL